MFVLPLLCCMKDRHRWSGHSPVHAMLPTCRKQHSLQTISKHTSKYCLHSNVFEKLSLVCEPCEDSRLMFEFLPSTEQKILSRLLNQCILFARTVFLLFMLKFLSEKASYKSEQLGTNNNFWELCSKFSLDAVNAQ